MKNKKILITLAVIVFVTAIYFLFTNDKSIEVMSMKSYMGSITKTIAVKGTINSSDVEVITLEQGMDVIKTYIMENDLVEENQLLAELDANELYITLEKSKLSLEELYTKLNDNTQNNNALVLLSNTLMRSKEDYSKLSEDLILANEDLEKAQILYNEKAISKAEYDKYATVVNNLNSKLKTAELNLEDANANYNNSTEQKTLTKLSLERQIKSLNLDIESLNKKIEDTKIYSSIKGIVTKFPLKESRKTLNGERITIHGTSSYELTTLVSQQDAVLIKEGQKSIVTVDGLESMYEGIVSNVSKIALTDNSGSLLPKVEIKIEITNPDNYLTFGYECEAKIVIDSQDELLVVKNESVKKEGDKEFLYLINDNSARKTYVETGITDGYLINIKSGINENDLIIVNPPVELKGGMKVKTVE